MDISSAAAFRVSLINPQNAKVIVALNTQVWDTAFALSHCRVPTGEEQQFSLVPLFMIVFENDLKMYILFYTFNAINLHRCQ